MSANTPVVLLALTATVLGLTMVLAFRLFSNQAAIHRAKERLKAHLLALRLFQDQLSLVLRSYGRILLSTLQYLRHAFKPVLILALPLAFMISYLDGYFASKPIAVNREFLVKVRAPDAGILNSIALLLPTGIVMTAPPVHIPLESTIAWRLVARKAGDYRLGVQTPAEDFAARIVVGPKFERLTPDRAIRPFWERVFTGSDSALPPNPAIHNIEVEYPPRQIRFAGLSWDWVWLFLTVALCSAILFKTILRVEV